MDSVVKGLFGWKRVFCYSPNSELARMSHVWAVACQTASNGHRRFGNMFVS